MLKILGSKVLSTNNKEVVIEAYAKNKGDVIVLNTELNLNDGVFYDTSNGKLVGFVGCDTFGGCKEYESKDEYILAGFDSEECKWCYGEFNSLDMVHEYLEESDVTDGVVFYKGELAFTLKEGCLEQL